MIDDAKSEAVIRHLLGELPAEESAALAREIAADPELGTFAREAEAALAALAHTAPAGVPPAELEERIFAAIGGGRRTATAVEDNKIVAFPARRSVALPWAIAACLALGCGLLAWERAQRLREETGLRQEIAALQNQNQISQVAIVTLKARLDDYAAANAVLLWDQKRQTGELQIQRLPALKPDKDYQLWAINADDPQQPINAGLLQVGNDGKARVHFRPDKPVAPQHSFAVSIGPKGGTPAPAGPLVLATP